MLLQKLKDATPLTQPMRYAGTGNVRRYYENIQLPDRLFVLGDSAAAFNPVRTHPWPRLLEHWLTVCNPHQLDFMFQCLGDRSLSFRHPASSLDRQHAWKACLMLQVYGQGMTVSAVEAEALHNLLKVTQLLSFTAASSVSSLVLAPFSPYLRMLSLRSPSILRSA